MEAFRDRAQDALVTASAPTLDRILADAKIEGLPVQVRRMLVYLHVHLFHPGLDVKTWRREAGIRDNGVPTQFRDWLGTTPKKYLRDHRIETAARMLAATDLEEGKIARAVGYTYYPTFVIAYEACTGKKPQEDRRLQTPVFGLTAWQRALRGELAPEEAERLIDALRYHYPGSGQDASKHRADDAAARRIEIDGGEYELFRAERLWRRILLRPLDEQKREVRRYVFHSTVLFDMLRQKSQEEGRKSRRRGVELAELALVSLEDHEDIFDDRIHDLRALGWAWQANAWRLMLEFDRAEADLERADDEWSQPRAIKDLRVRATILQIRSTLRTCQRRYIEALELVKESIELCQLVSDTVLETKALILQASLEGYMERPREAASLLREASSLIEGENEIFLELKISLNQANVQLRLGNNSGMVFLEDAAQYCTKLGSRVERCELQFLKGGFYELSSDFVSAEKAYAEALEGFLGLNEQIPAALVSLHIATLFCRAGKSHSALDLIGWALPTLQSLDLHEETAIAIELLAQESARMEMNQKLVVAVVRSIDLDPLIGLNRQPEAAKVTRPPCLHN